MLKVTVGKRTYPTGIKKVDDIITIWMVTLSMLVDVNMPMNLMGAGITAAPAVSPGIESTSHSRKKYSAALQKDHKKT